VEYAVESYNGILLAAERRWSTKNLLKEACLNSEQNQQVEWKTGSPLARVWHHMELDYNHTIKGQFLNNEILQS
jgi:hypothetical protein